MNAHAVLGAFLAGLALLASSSLPAQTPGKSAPVATKAPATPARPTWQELTGEQREALAPLAHLWETLDADRKRKWLEVAARYPALAPEGKQRVHQRMAEFAKLTPEQRRTARENFRRAYELPAIERQEKLERYQSLPDEKKRELAKKAGEDAAKKPDLRRPPGDGKAEAPR